MRVDTNLQKINELLNRSIEKIYPSKEKLAKLLRSGKRLRVYYGIDPTAPTLHLDNATGLFILKRFQELNHEVIFLIGDFTAQIGDPTGKISTRRQLSRKEIIKNYKNYKYLAEKILSFDSRDNPAKLVFNSHWLRKLKLEEIINLISKITVGRIIARDMFQNRIKEGKEIYLHEFIYPLLQGYDSVVLDVDVEIGGTDQIFNMLIGRDLVRIFRNKEKFVIAKKLLEDPKTGKILMSKSEGRFIALDDPPFQMYAKIMALPDEIIPLCFEHWTEIPIKEIKLFTKNQKDKKITPQGLKARLAYEITQKYHSKDLADKAEKEFELIFRKKELPTSIPEYEFKENSLSIINVLLKTGLVKSASEAKRLINQNAVQILILGNNREIIDRVLINNWHENIELNKNLIVKIGTKRFVKIKKRK